MQILLQLDQIDLIKKNNFLGWFINDPNWIINEAKKDLNKKIKGYVSNQYLRCI